MAKHTADSLMAMFYGGARERGAITTAERSGRPVEELLETVRTSPQMTGAALADVRASLKTVTLEQARAMIDEVRITALIKGFRGLPKGDIEALAQTVVAFSRLAAVQGVAVQEAEINPLFVQENGAVAVDGLIRLGDA